MRNSMAVLDGLRERGFSPEEIEDEWFALAVNRYLVRVVQVDGSITVLVLTLSGVSEWYVNFSDDTPLGIVMANIDLAIADAVTRDIRAMEREHQPTTDEVVAEEKRRLAARHEQALERVKDAEPFRYLP